MIYNIQEYLETELPGETVYSNVKNVVTGENVPDRIILVQETGGQKRAWLRFTSQSIQIMTRDIDPVKARDLAYQVYETLDNKFGLILPQVTVDGVLYAEKQIAQISAESTPQSLGTDESGRYEFVTNYRFIFSEE